MSESRMAKSSRPPHPAEVFALGVFFSILGAGGVLYVAFKDDRYENADAATLIIAWIISAVGGLALLLGTIAWGVYLGVDYSNYKERRRADGDQGSRDGSGTTPGLS